jgi:hypothetical protein
MLYACVLALEIRIPASGSLKSKRTVIKHLVVTSKARFGVAAAEVGYQGKWQRSELGFAAVADSQAHVQEVLDSVERFVWSHPEIEVLSGGRRWLEDDE